MAVQAQYPSNVLFLNNNNNRTGQEMKNNNNLGNDYTMQNQIGGGGLLDQSQMFFNNNNNGVMGINNPRKRGREAANGNGNGGSSATTTTTGAIPISLFSLQPQPPPPTIINLAQLHNQQPNFVSTGLGLAFGEQNQQHQNLMLRSSSSSLSSILSEDLTCQINQQRDEIDQFLRAQGEELRRTLAKTRQSHYRALLGVAEESATRRLREKQSQIQKAASRNAELEQRMAQLRAEAQAWQNKARQQEATAASLQLQLQQAMMDNRREEGVGCSGEGEAAAAADDAESAHVDPDRVEVSGRPSCKACGARIASVVLLPCRHLSLCTECNAATDTCPLCLAYRTASVEVYLS